MNGESKGSGGDGLIGLAESYVNGTLDDNDLARLERMLLDDAAARSYFRRYLSLDAALREHGESAGALWSRAVKRNSWRDECTSTNSLGKLSQDFEQRQTRVKSALSSRLHRGPGHWSRMAQAAGIGGIAMITVVAIISTILNSQRAAQGSAGMLEEATGDVRILGADGRVRSIDADSLLAKGDTVRIRGSESSTVLAYPDGTRLVLVGNTSVTCGDHGSKTIVVHQGTLSASVAPQPTEKPLLLTTPAAQLQVLGTRFQIEAVANRTDLSVSKGHVRVVRTSDGKTVDVWDGKHTVVTEQNKLEVQDAPSLSETWEVDFERAMPPEWDSGERVTEGLPRGSHGAVKAVQNDDEDLGDLYSISSHEAWLQGLFAIRKTSHIHVTFKLENPKWINMLLVMCTSDPHEPRFSGNYLFKDFPWIAPGEWQTLSVPFAEFQRIHRGDVPLEKVTPYKLTFFSDAPDRGLMIDRIWVTPEGPGKVELKAVE